MFLWGFWWLEILCDVTVIEGVGYWCVFLQHTGKIIATRNFVTFDPAKVKLPFQWLQTGQRESAVFIYTMVLYLSVSHAVITEKCDLGVLSFWISSRCHNVALLHFAITAIITLILAQPPSLSWSIFCEYFKWFSLCIWVYLNPKLYTI